MLGQHRPLWVNRVVLTVLGRLPVYLQLRTCRSSHEATLRATSGLMHRSNNVYSIISARVRALIRATLLSEGPQSTASRWIARPGRSTPVS